jgi:hypothetical protein
MGTDTMSSMPADTSSMMTDTSSHMMDTTHTDTTK